jgi:hypothetical protein
VAGSRNMINANFVSENLLSYINKNNIDMTQIEIVSGCARGADKMGEIFAQKYNIKLKQFPANWDLYGKSAGYKRNEEMAKYATHLVAFWNGESRGTLHMINLAAKYNLPTKVFSYKNMVQ